MIQFNDFVPRMRSAPGFLKPAEYDSFDEAAAAASRWIEKTAVDVVNIETVVLPNIHRAREEGSADSSLHSSGEMATSWHQFVRVWYERRA